MKCIATLLLAAPLLVAAQTYDLATDFSSTRNSAEPWQYGWSNGSGQTFMHGGDTIGISAQLAMVPEPSSALMSGLGLALMCLWLRRHGRE